MKKILFRATAGIAIALCSFHANAQFSKGTVMLGTSIASTGYTSANSDYDYTSGEVRNTKTNGFTFSVGPQIGFFLTPRFVLGATPSFSISTSHATNNQTNADASFSNSTTNTTTTTVSIGPFARYYFSNLASNNWFFAQVNGAVGTGSGTTTGNTDGSSSTSNTDSKVNDILTWNAGGSLGMTHFFHKRIGMDIAVGYNYSHVHNNDVNTTNTTAKSTGHVTEASNNYVLNTATNGFSLGVGFHWFL